MDAAAQPSPEEIATLRGALVLAEARGLQSEAELAVARAEASDDKALIAHQRLRIAKLERQLYGQRSERQAQLIDQMELELEEREASASADELAAELAAARTTRVCAFVRRRPEARTTFPEHLPRERVLIDAPTACECCGSARLRKLGEDVTRTLESIPRRWKVVETVREKFTCRDCEKISQSPAPFHVIPRGWAGPSLLAMILYEKFGAHQPLNRLCERFALEGVPIPLSTAADAVGAACQVLQPVLGALERHVFSAGRLHGDDTTVTPVAVSPIALEVVRRIDQLFEVERQVTGQTAEQRLAVRQSLSRPLAEALHAYLQEKVLVFSRSHDLYKAIQYILKRWTAFTLFLQDGRICLSNNAAERALRGIALGRKSWLFCGSDRGGHRAATMYSLIVSCKMNGVDPQVWLADVLARIAAHPAHRVDELLPWTWKALREAPLACQIAA